MRNAIGCEDMCGDRLCKYIGCKMNKVLLRTPITQMIFFNHGMLLLGSNHFLKIVTVSQCMKNGTLCDVYFEVP